MDPHNDSGSPPLATIFYSGWWYLVTSFTIFITVYGFIILQKEPPEPAQVNIPLGSKTRPRVVYLSGIPLGALEGGNPPVLSCVGKPLSRWLKV